MEEKDQTLLEQEKQLLDLTETISKHQKTIEALKKSNEGIKDIELRHEKKVSELYK